MSFGGQSNQWQRNNVSQLSSFQPQQMQMFLQQGQSQTNMAFGAWPEGGNSVSYPQPRATGLNPVAFQQAPASGSSGAGGGAQSQHYNSIGTVTKINSDCGLVNDEVFFYRNVCKGHAPKLGDRVLFEATYSSSGQFKWNATRIQLMPQQPQQPPPLMDSGGGGKTSSAYSAVPPPNEYQRAQQMLRHKSPVRRFSPSRDRHARSDRDRRERDRSHRSRDRDDDEHSRKRRREDHERSREHGVTATSRAKNPPRVERERDRERVEANAPDHSVDRKEREREREKEREKERVDRSMTKAHRTRANRRYKVQIPKSLLSHKTADVQELRQRYSTLYVPSDFFHANIKWPETFTPDNPFSLRRPCQFHIMHKIVETPYEESDDLLEPADADYMYSAKVMLLSCPPIAEIYQKCFEQDDSDNEQNAVHPSRLISFLVGTRRRNEPMAIGGPWSAALDGKDPDKDPAVLIRTAIRTCRALTGIDLSNCTQWYRFMELYYHRTDYKHKEKEGSPRVEKVVIYLPDIHSCMPSVSEWQTLTQAYKQDVENVIARKTTSVKAPAVAATAAAADAEPDNNNADQDDDEDDASAGAAELGTAEEMNATADDVADADADGTAAAATDAKGETTQEVVGDGDDYELNQKEADQSGQPTHYSQLELKTMKVQQIRDELIARDLPVKGTRNLLMARLAKALNTEKVEEANRKKAKAQLPVASHVNEEVIEIDCEDEPAVEPENAASDPVADNEAKAEDADEQEDWADVMDVDMSDIVILDEYDSSKNPEESTKEMDEKEQQQLRRRYTLPSARHIIVHPNKIAKGGKFDCSVMSLSVLLDYCQEDTKERFFEVSLFAELFNEMLMRDFGFTIYKELCLYKAPSEGTESKDEEANNKEEIGTQEEDEKTKETAGSKATADVASDKSAHERRVSKRSMDEQPEDDNLSAERKRKSTTTASVSSWKDSVSDKKMAVVKPQLLLSFIYFDTSHCGYIFEKDLEDLFSILGLKLSRGQIHKVLGKLATRQSFHYRKLTDKEESPEDITAIEDADDIPAEQLKSIAMGNQQYTEELEAVSNGDATDNTTTTSTESDGLVNFNGAVVHVGKLVEQIKRTEKSYSDLEKLHNDIRKKYTELQKEHSKSSGKMKDLQSEVKSLSRKLSDADQDVFTLTRKCKEQTSTLSSIYNRVSPYFAREKDKEHKSESSRDKDDKGDKDKDKHKDVKDNKEKNHKAEVKHEEKHKKDVEKDRDSEQKINEEPVTVKSTEEEESCDSPVKEKE